jgi:hypothetical protein
LTLEGSTAPIPVPVPSREVEANISADIRAAKSHMNFATMFSLGLTIALAAASDATASERRWVQETRSAQARPDAVGAATENLRGIGLTASHKRIIFDHVAPEQTQAVPKNTELSIGSTIPDSLMLNTMPIAAKDQIGVLKDYKFVKVADDKILLVDPATRQIVDIVIKQEAQ